MSTSARLRNRCEQIDFGSRLCVEGSQGWKSYVVEELDEVGYVWSDASRRIIAFGPETWRILGCDQRVRYALIASIRDAGASGIREIPLHSSPYVELVLHDAAANGTDVVQSQDRFEALQSKLMNLLGEAETLTRSGVSPRARQVFVLRFAQAQQEYDDLAHDMDRMSSLVRLVADAVMAAATGSTSVAV